MNIYIYIPNVTEDAELGPFSYKQTKPVNFHWIIHVQEYLETKQKIEDLIHI